MKITLVRHGQTEQNRLGCIQGLKNNYLSDIGRKQCEELKEKLKSEHFDICYMSPLVRTVETALILIGDRVETVVDSRIIERNMGELEGKPRNQYDVSKYWDYSLNCSELGVEPIQSIFQRCQEFLDYILEKHRGQDILIVSHGAPVRALRHLLLKHSLQGNLLDIPIDNCFCETIEIDEKNIG